LRRSLAARLSSRAIPRGHRRLFFQRHFLDQRQAFDLELEKRITSQHVDVFALYNEGRRASTEKPGTWLSTWERPLRLKALNPFRGERRSLSWFCRTFSRSFRLPQSRSCLKGG
jgi:hypothetical protein